MIVLGVGCRGLNRLMRDSWHKSGPDDRTALHKTQPEAGGRPYLTVCSSPPRQTR